MATAEAPRAARACGERDFRIEQPSRPLDPPRSTSGALAARNLDVLDAAIIAGTVKALHDRARNPVLTDGH
jgi:hypothetical protein